MSKALENMEKILTQSGAYRIPPGSPLEQELSAYAAGLDLLLEEVEALLQELFIATAPPQRLAQWQALAGLSATALEEGSCRAVLSGWFGAPRCPAPGDLPGLLLAAGVRGTAEEAPLALTVTTQEAVLPASMAAARLARLLPAWVSLSFV